MKVFLGKYPEPIRIVKTLVWISVDIFNYIMKFLNIDVKISPEKIISLFVEHINKIDDFLIEKLSLSERKEKVIIHDYDVWSLDSTLALIIRPALIKLKEVKHGAPHVDDDDVPDEIKRVNALTPTQNTWDTDEFFFKRWDYVLDEMIWAFTEINSDFVKYDRAEREEREARMQKAFCLFGRYFRAMWD